MVEKRKLVLAFVDNSGKVYQIDEVTRAELADGLEKISRNREETVVGRRTKMARLA
jgi:hypothetical protein